MPEHIIVTTPSGTIESDFPAIVNRTRSVTDAAATFSATDDYLIFLDPGGADRDANLPAINTVPVGKTFIIVNTGSNKKISVESAGSELIGENLNFEIDKFESLTVISNGTDWKII